MSRVFISPLATPFHSLVSIFPIPSRYISIFRAPPPRYFSPSLNFSLGIELEGTDTEPYTDAQYTALAGLTRLLRAAFPAITPERIQGHCDIAPERKTDPGEAFDWSRYRAGLTYSKEET